MNNSFIRIVAVICVAMLSILNVKNSLAGNYSWTGSADKEWNNPSNWSPSGTPSMNDTVTIGTGSDTLLIADNTTINRLVISGRVVNLGGYQLEISQRASLNGGKIYNGTMKMRGTYAFFQGTNTNCMIDCIVNQIKLSGGTFDGTGTFEQNGTANGWGDGGCVFNGAVTMKKSGTASFRLGGVNPDTFNGKATFICTTSGNLEVSHGSQSVFRDSVFLNTTHTTAHISFCNSSTLATLEQEAVIVTGASGLTNGKVTLKALQQTSNKSNILSGTGNLLVNVDSCQFAGEVRITSPSILIKNNIFNGATTLIKTTASTNSYSSGGNIFNSTATIENQDATRAFRLANESGDTYNSDVKFDTGTNNVQVGYKGNNYFAGNITINSTKVVFNASTGKVILKGANDQMFYGEAAYNIGKLEINKDAGTVTLTRSMTIDSSITFVNGIINTDSTITLKAAVSCSGASNLSFVDGPVKKIGNTAFVFPVGDERKIGTIEISAPAVVTESYTARYFSRPALQVSDSLDTTLSKVSMCNYWSLNRNSGTTNVKVKLFWDTLGCAIFDTAAIRVAEFNGSNWRSLGKMNLSGNVDIGNFQNFDNVTGYNYFTFGIIVTTLDVTADISQSVNRLIQEDFFGFNGSNTIGLDANHESIQSWGDLFSDGFVSANASKTLAYSPVNVVRYPAGTLSNYFDWRSGWFIREKHLPNNWLYDKSSYRNEPDYLGNEMSDFRDNLNLIAARPLLAWNILTSKLNYEIASTYRLGEVNLPLKYIEIGNEFYLNDEQYKEEFPTVLDYYSEAKEWIHTYRNRNIPQSSEVKFAIVGADYGPNTQGRRKLWLETILQEIDPSDEIAAVTIHDYIESGINVFNISNDCKITGPTYLASYLNKAFKDGETLRLNAFSLVQQANQGHLSTFPLEIWMTEFNNLDFENAYIGTWPHGLFNAAMALQYLETPAVGKVITHTMISDAVFGNIFESDHAFDNIKCHGALNSTTTRKGEFTALGSALNQIAMAMKNATNAKKIVFTPTSTGSIPTIISSSNYPVLYGWYFENIPGEKQLIILNLDFDNSNVYNLDISSLNLGTNLHYDQITCSDFQDAILGSAINSSSSNELLLSSLPVSGNVSLQAGSITRIYQQTTPLQLKLTDDVICVGSSTSLAISGGEGAISVSAVSGLTISNLPLGNSFTSDHYWEITATVAGTYIITVTDANSNTATVSLIVHDKISDLEIRANNSIVTDPISFCPGATPIILEATYIHGSGSGPNNQFVNDYHIIWAPDTGITSNLCSGSDLPVCHTIYVSPDRTTRYSVYVTNDNCWSSASVIVEVPISSVNLGPDFNACTGTNNLNPIVLEPEVESSSTYTYQWSISSPASIPLTINTISAGINIYTVTVTSTSGCSVEESIQITGKNCCTGIANALTVPPINYLNPESQLNEYFISGEQLYTEISALNCLNCSAPSCAAYFSSAQTNPNKNNQELIIDFSQSCNSTNVLLINQEVRVQNDIRDAANNLSLDGYDVTIKNTNIQLGPNAKFVVRDGRTLTLENCTLIACGTEMWKGIEVVPIADDATPHIIIKDCIIRHAKQSVLLGKDSEFEIENTLFEDNYVDISFEKYQKKSLDQKFLPKNDPNGLATQNFIRSNTFTSSGGTLLSPYNNVHKFAAIVLDDVERVVIGDSSEDVSVDYNYFSNSNFGIKAYKSNFEVYHSDFVSILDLDPQIDKLVGTAIYVQSTYDYNDRSIIIGNKNFASGATSAQNHFVNLNNGIVASGEMNVKIFNNVFGNGNVDARIRKYGIWTNGTWEKSVYITRENIFYDYYTGIRANMIHPRAVFHIGNNTFNDAYVSNWNAIKSFEGTAIYLANYFGMPVNLPFRVDPQVVVFDNTIGEYGSDIQPRIGIYASQIFEPVIQNNVINYYRNSPVTLPHSFGIWTQNCNSPFISSNTIRESQNSYPGYGANLIGIRSDRNLNPCIGNANTIENLGYALHFSDNNGMASISTNIFNRCDNGVNLDRADIGQQGNPDRTDDNEWYDLNSTNERVKGLPQSLIPVQWYWNSSNSAYAPIPSNAVSDNPTTPPANYQPLACPSILNILQRNTSLGGAVLDTNRYDENYFDSFNYTGKLMAFKVLKKDTSLLELDDPSDSVFVSFYNEMATSNLNILDSISSLICEKKIEIAFAMLEDIQDTNVMETLLLSTYEVLMSLPSWNAEFTSPDSTALLEIANIPALLYGDAVYSARNKMFHEVVDDSLGSNLRAYYNHQPTDRENKMVVHPNPSSNYVFINVNNLPFSGNFQLMNLQGKIVRSGSMMNGFINIQELPLALYHIRIIVDGEILTGKIAIIR